MFYPFQSSCAHAYIVAPSVPEMFFEISRPATEIWDRTAIFKFELWTQYHYVTIQKLKNSAKLAGSGTFSIISLNSATNCQTYKLQL